MRRILASMDRDELRVGSASPRGAAVPLRPQPPEHALPVRALVCDDDPTTRRIVVEMLAADGGFTIVGEASTGRQSIVRAVTLRPDLVVLDLSMPELDGLRAIPLLRACAADTAILVLTASSETIARRALEEGADGYLDKGPGFSALVPRAREVAATVRARRIRSSATGPGAAGRPRREGSAPASSCPDRGS